ncbi:riboflavin kinase, partial [Burkholderia cenocepacia]
LPIAHKRPALAGIFVVQVHGLGPEPLPGVASLGLRPTVDDSGRVLLEVHLLDWHGDAYGKLIRVEFLKKLRDEAKFDDLEALSRAIALDVANARAYFIERDRAPGSRATGFATSATDRIS